MKPIRTLLLLLPLVSASGCSTLQGYFEGSEAPRTAAVPLTERAELAPISRNYFVLDDPAQSVIGDPQIVFTRAEDTLSDLAREYGLGYDELVEANPDVDPWLPGDGTPVLLPTQYVLPDGPRQGIVLNIASKRLFYFPAVADGGAVEVLTFPIGIGRVGWETPLGAATVVSRARDPQWYPPASVRREHAEMGDPLPAIVPPGPDNPLGRFVLKLDMPGYLIHGTNQPYGVGMRVSHGCVRLYPENIELLYSLVGVGTEVVIVNQPYLAGSRNGELFVEVHRALEDDAVSPAEHRARLLSAVEAIDDGVDLVHVGLQADTLAADARGVPVRVLQNDIDEVFERARVVRNTVEYDPDAPTLAEVREILDAPLDEELDTGADAEQGAPGALDE